MHHQRTTSILSLNVNLTNCTCREKKHKRIETQPASLETKLIPRSLELEYFLLSLAFFLLSKLQNDID